MPPGRLRINVDFYIESVKLIGLDQYSIISAANGGEDPYETKLQNQRYEV
jgi:hypothetical protein